MLILCQHRAVFLQMKSDIFPHKTRYKCMNHCRKILINRITFLIFAIFLCSTQHVLAADGEALFKANCANCHKPLEAYTGPALQGARTREPNKDWAVKWVQNVNTMYESDPYVLGLRKTYPSKMTQFGNLSKEEITSILDYADAYKAPVAVAGKEGEKGAGDGNALTFGILTLVLALIAFILIQVNSNLRKLSDDKEGVRRLEPVPFYKNKTYLMAGVLLLFALGGYTTINGAINMGRSKNYQPEQPIYYSHKVHAGVNQISCLYCHNGAQDGKHSNIPSVNTCMNCHMAIKEYKGEEKLVREDGTAVNGNEEIQKLYKYAGWNPSNNATGGSYNPDKNLDGLPDGSKPIEWVRIHNLPDHVYFNHSQHVNVGKQNCQTCHGNIQEMPEVYQYSDLSMGWCINCHRESKVDFYNKADSTGNKFYSIYEKFHTDIANHKLDSVTVEKIGGTECQKCHY
jgi:cytochrome c2